MVEFDYHQLNDIIHSRLRLAVISTLIHYGESDFNFIKKSTGSSDGNLSINTKKLIECGYLVSQKEFINDKPVTKYSITEKGKRDYEIYINRLLKLIKKL